MAARSVGLAVAIAATAGLLVAGCGSDDDETATPAATAAAAPAALPADLVGTYTRRVTAADIARTDKTRREGGGQQAPQPGPGRLTFRGSTMTFVDLHASPPFAIAQTVKGSDGALEVQSYVRPEEGSFCGPEVPQNATYRWTVDGDALKLTAVHDTCADRDSSLSGTWRRQG